MAVASQAALTRPPDTSPLKKRFKADVTRAKLAELKLWIMDGLTDLEIQEKMGETVTVFNELKRELYRQETARMLSKTTEDVYLEYQWAQAKCLADLEGMITSIQGETDSKQQNALVGAIKAKSDIIDKVLKTGQDMGVINREPERKINIHGHAVINMTNTDLRKAITQEMQGLSKVIDKYGARDMAGDLITDGAQGPSFSEQTKSGMAMSGPAKAAAARESRKVVKRQKVIDVGPK